MSQNEMRARLESALSEASVVLLAIGPGQGAVYTTKQILGPMTREIDVQDIELKLGVEGLKSVFKEAASRGESVAVTGLGNESSGLSAEAKAAAAEGVRGIAAGGGRAVVVAHSDISDMDFGPARFVGAMGFGKEPEFSAELSSALLERFRTTRAQSEAPSEPNQPKPAGKP